MPPETSASPETSISPASSAITNYSDATDLDINVSQLIDPGTGAPIISAASPDNTLDLASSPAASPTSSRKLK